MTETSKDEDVLLLLRVDADWLYVRISGISTLQLPQSRSFGGCFKYNMDAPSGSSTQTPIVFFVQDRTKQRWLQLRGRDAAGHLFFVAFRTPVVNCFHPVELFLLADL